MVVKVIEFNLLNDKLASNEKTIICIGKFEAFHNGHKKLISETLTISKEKNLKPYIAFFATNPLSVLKKDSTFLSTNEDKINILTSLQVKNIIKFEFNKEIAQIEAIQFIEILKNKLNASMIVCGSDFRFGFKGLGTIELLKKHFGIANVIVIPYEESNNQKISSSLIKDLLKESKIEEANQILGRYYKVDGFVVEGKKNGRKIGFPTANIKIFNNYLMPGIGVYLVRLFYQQKTYFGMANIGYHPTIDKLDIIQLEVHILDFDEDIYDQFLEIEFLKYIRKEKKFNNLNELKNQLSLDKNYCQSQIKLFD